MTIFAAAEIGKAYPGDESFVSCAEYSECSRAKCACRWTITGDGLFESGDISFETGLDLMSLPLLHNGKVNRKTLKRLPQRKRLAVDGKYAGEEFLMMPGWVSSWGGQPGLAVNAMRKNQTNAPAV